MLRRTLSLALCLLACRPAPTSTPAAASGSDVPAGVPDDAFALVDGTAIPRASFDDAIARHASGGPSSRDDRGLRQHVGVAVLTRELVRLELTGLGLGDATELGRRALPLVAALASVSTARGDASTPSWWAVPPLTDDDRDAAVLVAAELGKGEIPDAELTAEYERSRAERWSSSQPWQRVDLWSIEYADGTGIDACDDYVAKYRRCTAKFPAATRPNVLADLRRQANAWREAADEPERATVAGHDCEAAASEAMQQTQELGCDWQSSADADEARARAARKRELAPVIAAARERIAGGEDPLVVAAELGARAELRRMLAADELAKPVAKAARNLAAETWSKPLDDGRSWTIVRVLDRRAAGTLPLDAVKEDLAEQLRTRRLADAFEGLPATLRARHRVELHPDYESLEAAPDGAGL